MSDLLVRLRLDDKGLDAQLKGVGAKFKSAAAGIAAITVPVAAIAGIAKLVDGLAAIGERAIQAAGSLQDTSEQLGVTAEKLQELRLIAGNAGVDVGQLDKSLSVLNRTLGQASLGQGEFEKIAGKAGLSLRDENNHIKSTAVVWDDLTKRIQSGALSQNQAIGLASAAFGREGGKMVAVLKQTAEEQQRVIDTARQFGAVLSNEVVRSADAYGDQLVLIQKGTEAIGIQTDLILAPLTLKWAALKNEIAGATLELARAVGLVDDNATLQTRRLKQMEQQIGLLNDALKINGVDPKQDPQMQKRIADWQALKVQIDAANAAAKAANDAAVPSSGDEVETDDDKAKKLEVIDVSAQKIEAERSFQQMLLDVQKEAQLEQLDQAITVDAQRIEAIRTWHDLEVEMTEQHESEITKIMQDAAATRLAFDRMTADEKTKHVLGGLVQITEGVAQHSKKMFNLNKAAALAMAAVDMAQGIAAGVKLGWPLGIPAVAWAVANGASAIASIKKTQFSGGGTGTTPSAAGAPVVNSQPVPSAAGGSGKSSTIRVEGINSNALFTGRALRELLERLQDAQKDGGKLVVVGT